MKDDTQKKITTILDGVSKKSAEEANVVRVEDPTQDLRVNVLNFFNSRINSINSQEKLKLLVQEKLENKLETEELTFAQLKDLFVVLSREGVNASQDILKVAHPNPGQSPIADDLSRKHQEDSNIADSMGKFSSEDTRKIDTLFRLLQKAAGTAEKK